MKILYNTKEHTIRELKENSKVHKMTRMENEVFKYLANNRYMTLLELKNLTQCDTFEVLHYNMRKLNKRLTIERKKYIGSRIKDEIWII